MAASLKRALLPGDFWGGFVAMLVALPASIAFGVTIYSAISPAHGALGALAGMVGATVIGIVAALFGGTDRLISAPCAPAAALLAAFALQAATAGSEPGTVVVLLLMLGLLAGALQITLGLAGVGHLIQYVPYPVVSGYMTGVGLTLVSSQLGRLLGTPVGLPWFEALTAPALWDWRAVLIGTTSIGAILLAPSLTRRVPATVIGLLAGLAVFGALGWGDPALFASSEQALLVGPLQVDGEGFLSGLGAHWHDIGSLHLSTVATLAGSALTLAVLLSIDTLKTCVVLDRLTRSRHQSDRELVAQGVANMLSAAAGGIPGAGTLGATLVNVSSGATSRMSGLIAGGLSLLAVLVLGSFIAWVPVATLSAGLIVVGVRMIDRDAWRYVQSPATVLDFGVVLAVVAIALSVGLMAASLVGVGLSVVLFLREQIGGSVVRHKFYVNQISSTWHRPEDEARLLEEKGDQAVIFELQGSLFFGTTQQLLNALEPELRHRRYVILDLKRVQSIDVTAAELLRRVRDILAERGAILLLSSVRDDLPRGRDLRQVLEQAVLAGGNGSVQLFAELDLAIEWVEDQLLGPRRESAPAEHALELAEMALFAGRKDETLVDLAAHLVPCHCAAGESIYAQGEPGDALYLIRRGSVKVFAPLGGGRMRHIATFGRGDFFGSLAFLDGRPRANHAVAASDCEFYVLRQEAFAVLAEEHKRLAFTLLQAIARTLAVRMRHADKEIAMLREY